MATSKTEVVGVRVEPPIKEAPGCSEFGNAEPANMVEVMVVAYCRPCANSLTGIPSDALPATLTRGSQVD